jgi:uncharacterized protein
MIRRFLPKEVGFFDFFERHAALTIRASEALQAFTVPGADLAAGAAAIKQIERDADKVTRECLDALHKTFITPMDRQHILELIKRMDDIIDCINGAAQRTLLYDAGETRSEAGELAAVLIEASREIETAVKMLRNIKNAPLIAAKCETLHQLESRGDEILRHAMGRLFKEADAITIIKWKEIFKQLERATDRCEDVASIIQTIVVEAS